MTCHINLIGIGSMNAAPSMIHANDNDLFPPPSKY